MFYAHTISPIAIAVIISLVMLLFLGRLYAPAVPIALFGDLNSFVLESLRGLDETIQYGQGARRKAELSRRSKAMAELQRELNRYEQGQRSLTNLLIEFFSFGMLFFMLSAYRNGAVDFAGLLLCTVTMMGSFGPVVALSSLSNNLNQTLASGERVLQLLEEEPQVEELSGGKRVSFEGARAENVSFSYGGEQILRAFSLEIPKGRIIGIHGPSGSGKSTLLKLLMRFWDAGSGRISLSDTDVRELNTANLREMESYVTQETTLFHDSIARNIAIGRLDASRDEIEEAARKASIHEFIQSLPQGYDTTVGELGDTLSGGEKQRIGLARAFLHDAPLLLLDEPTSNLDSLNEGIILKSLREASQDKTVVLVSHRESTMNLADTVYEMKPDRRS